MNKNKATPSRPVTISLSNDNLEIDIATPRKSAGFLFVIAALITAFNLVFFIAAQSFVWLAGLGVCAGLAILLGIGTLKHRLRILASPKSVRAQSNGHDTIELTKVELEHFYACKADGRFALAAKTTSYGAVPFISGFKDEESARSAEAALHDYWKIDAEPGLLRGLPKLSKEKSAKMILDMHGKDSFAYRAISSQLDN